MVAPSTSTNGRLLAGHTILVVEDQFLLADDLARELRTCGANVLGPAPGVERSLELMRGHCLTAAVLDVNLNGDMVYAVAEELVSSSIPFVVITGYPLPLEHAAMRDALQFQKPFETDRLVAILHRLTGQL
jgi:CheY-like chemotaxis protein